MTAHGTTPSFLRRIAAALASGLTVAVIGYVASLLAYFVAGNALTDLHTFFIWSALFVFLFSAILAIIGAYSRWYTTLAGGIVVAGLGALVGSTLVAVGTGHPFDGAVAQYAIGTLGGPNLIFAVAVVVATVTAGAAIWRVVLGREALNASRHIALVRPPAETLANGELTHLERVPVDLDLANSQWDNYVSVLAQHGWDIREVPQANEFADSVFIEDAVVMFGKTAVIASPGAESRVGESVEVEKAVRRLGQRIERIELPGTLDGGDVLKVGKTVYVGRGGRTNSEGIRQLRMIVAPLGYKVVAVPVTMALHLKSSVTALPDGTIIGYPPVVDNVAIFDRFLAVPEIGGLAVMVLAEDTVLMAASAPKSAALIADLGYKVITVDISEFEKLEGCVTCLSVRVR
ncbi:dimethylargininase [Parafrigoribacterium soli]|uniref:dimethylargininase n=1 Tax=Parafrigoribacterium soli TaxID=3144663 RepID=UPI0032EACEB5